MLAVVVFVSSVVSAPVAVPRECAHCGAYAGPNLARVTDPYLRQPNVWPEFTAATCQFEVSRGSFSCGWRSQPAPARPPIATRGACRRDVVNPPVAGFQAAPRLRDRTEIALLPPWYLVLAITVLFSTLATAPVAAPRGCPSCGAYAGPNVARVLDPYLRQPNVWPEFTAATCQFEVARGSFVILARAACTSETTYRAARRVSE